jgi:hypothetical protein
MNQRQYRSKLNRKRRKDTRWPWQRLANYTSLQGPLIPMEIGVINGFRFIVSVTHE